MDSYESSDEYEDTDYATEPFIQSEEWDIEQPALEIADPQLTKFKVLLRT